MSSENQAFDELREILLSKDKEDLYRINDELRDQLLGEIMSLRFELNDPDQFSQKITASRSQIIDILGPVMGKMIRKYIQVEIEKINQKLQESTDKLTSASYWKSLFSLKKKKKSIIDPPSLLEIMLISNDSGLLLAKYSKEEISDANMVAGMFTAIRSFMETVLEAKKSEVGLIDYGDYKIMVQGFGTFYFAFIFSGTNDPKFKQELIDSSNDFVVKNKLHMNKHLIDSDLSKEVENKFTVHFKSLCEK